MLNHASDDSIILDKKEALHIMRLTAMKLTKQKKDVSERTHKRTN